MIDYKAIQIRLAEVNLSDDNTISCHKGLIASNVVLSKMVLPVIFDYVV